MSTQDPALAFSTPKPLAAKPSTQLLHYPTQNRFLTSRKLDFVPGFDLGTPHKSDTSEACPIFKIFKQRDSAIISPDLDLLSHQFQPTQSLRAFPTQADKILDAPDIVDDYYLNLISWSDKNLLAVALRNRLYLWNGNTGYVEVLSEYREEIVTSVAWMKGGKCLAIGDSGHRIRLVDVEKGAEVRTIQAHTDRISALAWNGYVLSSGSRDSLIINHDLRIPDYFVKYSAHGQEICGLKWSSDCGLLASGGNDNKVCIWDICNSVPVHEFHDHKAAVKALAWCPWKQHLLASGGGSVDRTIKLWDCAAGTMLSSVDTGSQVSALEWNRFDKEILSAHGYTQNQLTLWKYGEMSKITEFFGHSARILNMCASPDGSSVVTAGADETLRFWNLFNSEEKGEEKKYRGSPGNTMNPGHR
jgi:WD40 repeat protein